jgi:hypothetical protein
MVRETEAELVMHGSAPEGAKFRCRVRGCLTLPVAYSGDGDHLVAIARSELHDGRAIGDQLEVMRALVLLSSTLGDDEHDDAVRAGEEALSLASGLRIPSYQAWAPMMLATRIASTDPTRAEQLLDEARSAAIRVGNLWAIRMAEQSLAQVQAAQGNYTAASRTMLSYAGASLSAGDDGATQSAVSTLSSLLAIQGDQELALLFGAFAESHGYDPQLGAKNTTLAVMGSAAYLDLRNRQASDVLDDVARRAAQLDAAALLALVAHRFNPGLALQN